MKHQATLHRLGIFTTALSGLLIGAHFLRTGTYSLVVVSVLFPLLLVVKKRWATVLVQLALVIAAFKWVITIHTIAAQRLAYGQPWGRMALILSVVALVTIISAILIQGRGESNKG